MIKSNFKVQNITTDHSGLKRKKSVVVHFKKLVLDLQFLPIFQLHWHTPDQTKISKQLTSIYKKLKIFNI